MSQEFGPWNIMTRTRGGTVSLLRNLTEDQARNAMQRLRKPFDRGDPWSDQAIRQRVLLDLGCSGRGGGMYMCSDGDLEEVTCWGPPNIDLVVWPKPDDYDERYAEALRVAREGGATAEA